MNTFLNVESISDASIGKSKLGEDVFEHLKSEINDALLDKYPVGKDVTGENFVINDSNVTAGSNAEIFNDYTNNIATGKYSHAENYQTISKGSYSHAEGYGTLASGAASHAEGYNTQATARYAHAEGAGCIASGNNSHAEGNECKSVGHYSHAEGNFTTANGSYSHTEGNYTTTGENATYAHAEGSYNEANAVGAHAEGNHTTSNAAFTHTEGMYTNASSAYQHVRGKYNEIDTNGLYNTIIGNGTSESDRRNIFTIDWDGNVVCSGKVTQGSQSITNNNDLISLQYLQNALSNIKNSIFDSIYPIGAIYISANNIDPFQLFGIGEWEQIKDTFLLAAGDTYTAGSTGGEATHTLTAKELPKQSGTISTHGVYSGTPIAAVSGVFSASHSCSGKYMNGTASGHDSVDTIAYSNGGQNAAHNNMPPYLTVYMWKRIN